MMSKLQLELKQKETTKELKTEEQNVRHIMTQTDDQIDEVASTIC